MTKSENHIGWPRIKALLQIDTAGWVATSSLILCALSGALLAIPYDFVQPYQSVANMLLFNPAGSLIRNFHYWSAQSFLIFFMLHVYDHFQKSTENKVQSRRTWFILVLAIAFAGYEMISGFVLKGDAAGEQARRILTSLLNTIPFAGKMLSAAFTGTGDSSQLMYVQHVATGTVLLFIAIYEHVRALWPRRKTWLFMFAIILIFSFFLRAPLGQPDSAEVKGPWFFVGIQELLHLTSHPAYVLLLVTALLLVVYFLPRFGVRLRRPAKQVLLFLIIGYLGMTAVVLLFRGENWQWRSWTENKLSGERLLIFDPVNFYRTDSLVRRTENQKPESCLLCHGQMSGLSESHKPSAIGCYACHKGDPFSTGKSFAHRNMVLVPGNFSNVRQTCGTQACHADIAGRMQKSLMTTQSGIIGVDKFVFGETSSPDDTFHVKNLGHTAADMHLRNLCAGCHLGVDKTKTGNPEWLERGGGCNACHLNYSDKATASMKAMRQGVSSLNAEIHPAIDIQVSNDRCLSCHSRSGRVSLSYEGWNEVSEGVPASQNKKTRKLPDGRILEFAGADVHHERGMACIDCHPSYDLMGDGKRHVHKEQAVHIQCVDCHPTGKVTATKIGELPDYESRMIAWLRKYSPETRILRTASGNYPLLNSRVDSSGQIYFAGKLDGKEHRSKPAASVCTRGKGHSRLSCGSCHTQWVPQCIGCHNAFEQETRGFDLKDGGTTRGSWVEYAGNAYADPPVLGVNEGDVSQIVTTMPGMILTIDKSTFSSNDGKQFRRLYAPASGHTTGRARSCTSCHNNPLAIGYGRGSLDYEVTGSTGRWLFNSYFALNPNDSLPEDAWIGFLNEARNPSGTRTTLRPFRIAEQKKILEVGSCLTCHDGSSKVMERALDDFEQTFRNRSPKCVVPDWNSR